MRSLRLRGAVVAVVVTGSSVAVPAFAQQGDIAAGQEVFETNCAMCHGLDASGMMGIHPSLRGAVERLSLEGVEVTIRKGRDTMPPMPSFEGRLSEEEIDDVVAYLDTLPVGPRNFGGGTSMMDMDGMMGGGMWAWFLWVVLFLVVVAAVVIGSVLVARTLWRRGGSALRPKDTAALEILQERYSRGDIDRNEYEERRTTLQG